MQNKTGHDRHWWYA